MLRRQLFKLRAHRPCWIYYIFTGHQRKLLLCSRIPITYVYSIFIFFFSLLKTSSLFVVSGSVKYRFLRHCEYEPPSYTNTKNKDKLFIKQLLRNTQKEKSHRKETGDEKSHREETKKEKSHREEID